MDQRIPKKMLVEHGAPTVAVPLYRDDLREYLEIAILSVRVRASHAKPSQLDRLAELIHRAVPYPLMLILSTPQGILLSMVHKRAAQNEAGKVVLDGERFNLELLAEGIIPAEFWTSLSLDRQPHSNLLALYQGWMDCLTAVAVSRLTGRFERADDPSVPPRAVPNLEIASDWSRKPHACAAWPPRRGESPNRWNGTSHFRACWRS